MAKEQENISDTEIKQLAEIDREIDSILDLKYKDISATIRKKLKVLAEMQDLMFEDIRETLKNDLKEMLEVIPSVKNSKNSTSRKESQEVKDLTSQKIELAEKPEGKNSKIDEDIESFTFNGKKINALDSKLDKAEKYNNQGKRLSQADSQNFKIIQSMGEASCNTNDRGRNCSILVEVPKGESQRKGEDEQVKEMEEEEYLHNIKNQEKVLTASKEEKTLADEGATLRLAADFSSATLSVNKQWGDIFNILRENGFEPKLQCKVQLTLQYDGETKMFSDLQSLSKFTTQKSVMKELLKDVLPQNEKKCQGGRRYEIEEKVGKSLVDSKHEAGGTTNDGLSFLFIKEVRVCRPEVKNLEIQEKEASEWKEKEAPMLEEQEPSGLEGEETSETEEEDGEETIEMEEEEGEEASGLEEEEEEEGEETSGEEEEGEEISVIHEEWDTTFQHLTVVDTKLGSEEITRDDLEINLIDLVVDSESEEEEEIGMTKTTSQTKKKQTLYELKEIAFSYLIWDSEKKKLVKRHMVNKTQEKVKTPIPRNQGIGTPCLTLYLASPTKSLEISNGENKKHSCTNASAPSGITPFLRQTEKERYKTLQLEELTSKEADLIQETEENFRRGVICVLREIQEEVGKIKYCNLRVLDIKNSIDDLYNTLGILEMKMNGLEEQMEEFSNDTMQMAKQIINKERLRDREDRFRSANIRLIGIPEKDNKENEAEDIIKEIIEENFPELKKDSDLEVVSANRIPSTIDENRLTPRHILVKFWNSSDKHKIIKASRERKEITYRGTRIRLTADLSLGTLDARSQWANIIKVLKEEGFQPRILYPAKLAFNFEGKTKVFFDIEEFRKFISCVPSLKELLENTL